MSIENKKKLKEIEAKFVMALQEKNDEVGDKLFKQASEDLDKILRTQDEDILPGLIDLFIVPDLDYTGACESLIDEIFQYYSVEQILDILYKKIDMLINNNITRAVQFFGAFMNVGYFNDIKKIFNEVKSVKSQEFLNELNEWYKEDYPKEIEILKQDMEKWNSKQ